MYPRAWAHARTHTTHIQHKHTRDARMRTSPVPGSQVLELSARLAEREVEVGRLLRRLEQSRALVASRDEQIAALSRRLVAAGSRYVPRVDTA